MGSFHSKAFKTLLMLSLSASVALGVESEYKNTLNRVELTKTQDGCTINLYMDKALAQSAKVIKKSDLNYYILLPETKNNAKISVSNNDDIRSVVANLYPYAGSDINNGYTKINISTTRPINFSINTKTGEKTSAAVSRSSIATAAAAAKLDTSEETAQKKNSLSSQSADKIAQNTKQPVALQPSQKAPQQAQKQTSSQPSQLPQTQNTETKPKVMAAAKAIQTAQQPKQEAKVQPKNNISQKIEQIKQLNQPKKQEIQKQEPQKIQQDVPEAKNKKEEIKPKAKQEAPQRPSAPVFAPKDVVHTNKADIETAALDNLQKQEQMPAIEDMELSPAQEIKEETGEEIKEDINEEISQGISEEEPDTTSPNANRLSVLLNGLQNALGDYGLSIKDLLLMIFAGLCSFVFMFALLTRKNENAATRLKSKADLADKIADSSIPDVATLTPLKTEENMPKKQENQCFVFDKNVKQTELLEPASSQTRKNYELSTYKPSASYSNSNAKPYSTKETKSEYDIIQRILRDDSFVEISRDEYDFEEDIKKAQTPTVQELKPVSVPIYNSEPKKETRSKEMMDDEPVVLSNVEIAPQRGFMCVSYGGQVSLVGYIFDDVFALYNFKQSKLDNYNIKFRMSEKTQNGANFIVKVEKSKMLVSVTKSSMNLEIAM